MQPRIVTFAFYLVCAVGLSALTAQETVTPGDVVLRVGNEGFIASWLQHGPVLALRELPPLISLSEGDSAVIAKVAPALPRSMKNKNRTWRVKYAKADYVSFDGKRPPTAYLAAILRANNPGTYWLATGSDGPLEIYMNGRSLLSIAKERKGAPDLDLVRLDLTGEQNILILKLKRPAQWKWRVFTRLMNDDFTPARDVEVVLPGVNDEYRTTAEATGYLSINRQVDLDAGTVATRLWLRFPGGYARARNTEARVVFRGGDFAATTPKELTITIIPGPNIDLGSYTVTDGFTPTEVEVSLDGATFRAPLAVHLADVKKLASASQYLSRVKENQHIDKTTLESLEWRMDHLVALIESGDRDSAYLSREIKNTLQMTELLANNTDPYSDRRGEVQRRGYLSKLDGQLHYYALYVPPGWRESQEKTFGLVVALHGLNAEPMKTIQSVFGLPLDEGETKYYRERHPKPLNQPAPFFVLAPEGFGNSSYIGYGEVDVLDVMNEVRRRYRIDPDRIYVTGASMGGIGAASLPLHFPDLFAAAAPLCGYHSLFQFRGIQGIVPSTWERFLLQSRSNANWAANGRHIPFYIVHGLKDTPGQSGILVNGLLKLRYNVKFETPNLGHNVWDITYEQGKIFKHFARYKRPAHPRQVTLVTAQLRYRSAYWIGIDDVVDFDRWSRVDASWGKDNQVQITTDNLSAFTVQNDRALSGSEMVRFAINKEAVLSQGGDMSAWHFQKTASGWEAMPHAPCQGLCKKPGLAGPIPDALFEPLLFVFGTAKSGEGTLTRRLVNEIRRPKAGTTIKWPIKADVDVTEDDIRTRSLVLVGTAEGNSLLRRIADRLPIRVDGNEIVLQDRKFKGKALAASFIYPNPLNPDRYVVVHTGVSNEALFYTAHLPDILPDFIIYDGPTWHRNGGWILNDRTALAAGFFDRQWKVKNHTSHKGLEK